MFIEKSNNLSESKSHAEKTCRESIANAGFTFGVPVSFHWSQLINPKGDKYAAIEAYKNLLMVEENNKSGLEGLAYLYQSLGIQNEAQIYRKKLKQVEVSEYGIQNSNAEEVVDYLLAKTGEAEKPSRVPSSFVSVHFDKYAEFFDSSLVDNLQYAGPQLIQEQIRQYGKLDGRKVKILDLGCGTGLVGKQISQYAKELTGVDLSENMLAKAAESSCYDKLDRSDILNYLKTTNNTFDIICAADVFNYLGELSIVFELVKSRLKSGGKLIFTVESTNKNDYRLCNTGRFQHHPDYIRSIIKQNDFVLLNEESIVIRKERDDEVNGLIYCLLAE